MKAKVYCPIFLGQGGYVFSMGMVEVARRLRAAGAETEIFKYKDFERARRAIRERRRSGYRIAGVGFSLGNTALTLLAQREHFDAVLCIAESVYAGPNNYPVKRVDRAVLWRNSTEPLSAAGGESGFDQIHELRSPHLMMPTAAADGVVSEVKDLMKVTA